jgi:hypothetical protein
MACCGWVLIMFTHYSCVMRYLWSVLVSIAKKKRLKAHFCRQILLKWVSGLQFVMLLPLCRSNRQGHWRNSSSYPAHFPRTP